MSDLTDRIRKNRDANGYATELESVQWAISKALDAANARIDRLEVSAKLSDEILSRLVSGDAHVAAVDGEWTTDVPKVAGWYWHRPDDKKFSNTKPRPVFVDDCTPMYGGQWSSEPIREPDVY